MTTMTLATIESRPLRPLRPLRPVPQARWLVHDLSTPTTRHADAVAAVERVHAALVLARLVVVAFLGAAAMVAGAVVGRL